MSSPKPQTGTVSEPGSSLSGPTSRRPSRQPGQPVLPLPPTDAEKAHYADRNATILTQASLFSFGALLVSQLRFVSTFWMLLVIFGPMLTFTVLYYLISLCVNFSARGFDMTAHHDLVRSWRPAEYPSLDIFLPICGEHPDVLRNTWAHVRDLAAAYPGAAIPYVLAAGASDAAAAIAGHFGVQY